MTAAAPLVSSWTMMGSLVLVGRSRNATISENHYFNKLTWKMWSSLPVPVHAGSCRHPFGGGTKNPIQPKKKRSNRKPNSLANHTTNWKWNWLHLQWRPFNDLADLLVESLVYNAWNQCVIFIIIVIVSIVVMVWPGLQPEFCLLCHQHLRRDYHLLFIECIILSIRCRGVSTRDLRLYVWSSRCSRLYSDMYGGWWILYLQLLHWICPRHWLHHLSR